jgi:hypothetical protein
LPSGHWCIIGIGCSTFYGHISHYRNRFVVLFFKIFCDGWANGEGGVRVLKGEFLNGFPDFLDGFSSFHFGGMGEEFVCIKKMGFTFDFRYQDAWDGGIKVDATNGIKSLKQ